MVACASDPNLLELLGGHPRVSEVLEQGGIEGIRFGLPDSWRGVTFGKPTCEQFGLTDLMDNNPMVCAEEMSLPRLEGSLALICLGPLFLSGLVREQPVFITDFEADEAQVRAALLTVGWTEGVLLQTETAGSVVRASGMAVIETPDAMDDLADLYEERFGKSPLIRMSSLAEWTPSLVEGRLQASFRMASTPDSPQCLLSVHAMCDKKLFEAAQAVHAMNIMCGFEDSLGLRL